ncbi:hypothetical protein AAU61_21385 [Desulfocarbo indianensis]|nr:hypothetical protein AAU61_21385 [Desulfocarbo indianensis]
MKEAQGALESLMDRALFVYRLEQDGQTYFHYHHLFRETLRKIAERELGAEAWGSFARSAADWLFGQGLMNEAILLLSRAQQWRHLAQVFSEHGQALICQNNLEVAAEALSQCPRVESERERWLCTILGHALLIRTPPEAISLLAKGRELAGQAGDQACELQACLGLIMYEMFIEANIGKLKAVLARAGQLYETLAGGSMASSLSYLCAYLLCFATAYCHAQYDKAESYITLARDTCQAPPEHGLEHQIVVAQAFNLAFQGDIGGGLAKLQKLFARDLNQLIGPANQFLAHAAYLNFSLMKGDIEGYKILRREMQEHFPELMAISYIGSFVNVWDMDLMLSEGRMDQVLERAEEALANPLIASNAHIKSQCLQYQAAALAFLGRSREARAALRRSMCLRAKAGGRFFTLLNRAMAACVLSLCPDHPEPERLFDLTLAFADQCEDSYVKPQLLAYRAHLRLRRGNERAALQDIQDFLGILESRRNRHFFLWESGMMKELLCHFHSQGHDNVAARTILRERFQLEEGPDQALLPILQCDTARGRLYFADASEEEALDIHELPANEYRLLNKLIASPGKYLCLDDLGDNLWGEGLWPKDPRNSLYQLLNKLRGRLQAMRPGLDGKLYIVSKPGYVKIDHIRVDLEVALRHMERADRAVEAGHYWAADIWQQKACNIIDGFGTEYVFPATLTQKMDRSMELWLGPIIERGAEEKALRLLEAAIKASPHNDGYHQARYRLLLKLDLPARAREAERQYARLLGEGVFEGSDLSGLLERS